MPCDMWDLPKPVIKPACPALAGEFPTPGPPGKPLPFLKGSFAKAVRFPELIRNPPAVRFKGGLWAFLVVAQMVKNLPPVLEIWVRFLGQEDPLEKGMATHSSILAWKILWTEKPGGLQSMGLQRAGHDLATNAYIL